jgi:hypothetical protein
MSWRSERAYQVVVEAGEGPELLLSLVRADGARASLLLSTGLPNKRPSWAAPTYEVREVWLEAG